MISKFALEIACLFCAGLSIIILIFLSGKIRKKFDGFLIQKNKSLPVSVSLTMPSSWGRTGLYAAMIAFNIYPQKPKSLRYKNYHKRFGDFNFREHATSLEIILSTLYLFFLFLSIILLFVAIIMGVMK